MFTPGPWKLVRGTFVDNIYGSNGALVVHAESGTDDMQLISATRELAELAKLVAQEYEDAADWKDARGKLAAMARAALEKAGIEDNEESE